jgi:hypothetical protein
MFRTKSKIPLLALNPKFARSLCLRHLDARVELVVEFFATEEK